MEATTHTLDARHLLCPMPVIRLQQLIEGLDQQSSGDIVEVIGTDPGILYDIPAWSKVHGHSVIESHEEDYEYFVTVKIGS